MPHKIWDYFPTTQGIPQYIPAPGGAIADVPKIGDVVMSPHDEFNEAGHQYSLEACDGSAVLIATHPELLLRLSGGRGSFDVVVPAASINSDLTDFLLLINLNDAPVDFWTAAGIDLPNFEVEVASVHQDFFSWDWNASTNTGYLFVKVDLSSSVDTTLTIKFGEPLFVEDNLLALSNYRSFFMASSNDGRMHELTSKPLWWYVTTSNPESYFENSNDSLDEQVTDMGLHPTFGFGFVNRLIDGVAGNKRAAANGLTSNDSNYTIAATARCSDLTRTEQIFASYTDGRLTHDNSISHDNVGTRLNVSQRTMNMYDPISVGDTKYYLDGTTTVNTTSTVRVHTTIDGVIERRLYSNGTHEATETPSVPSNKGLDTLNLGMYVFNGTTRTFTGAMSQVYIHNLTLGEDFISAEYANMDNPALFYNAGSTITLLADRPDLTDLAVPYKVVADYQG